MGEIRVIGGKWRGRKLHFPDSEGLRPTPDRIRETLFNWLMPDVQDVTCLDLFAGSGALGFEALSRGAKHVTFVDQSQKVVDQLQKNMTRLNVDNAEVLCVDYQAALKGFADKSFNIVFLDPPFHKDLITTVLEQLHCLHSEAWVYIEIEKNHSPLQLPTTWDVNRQATAGDVACYLCKAVAR